MVSIRKYILFIFLLFTVSVQYLLSPFEPIHNLIFMALMGIGVVFIAIYPNIIFNKDVVNSMTQVYLVSLISILYQLSFGLFSFGGNGSYYLFAKISFTILLIISLVENFDFYFSKMYLIMPIIIAFMLLIGWNIQSNDSNGQIALGFGNRNSTGAIAAFSFAMFMLKNDIPKIIRWSGVIISVMATFMSGSRGAIVLLLFSFLFIYKTSLKLIIGLIALYISIAIILPSFGYNSIGLNRLIDTVNRKEKTNREKENLAAFTMFKDHIITGNGLNSYKETSSKYKKISKLGSHNGYLSIAKMYGIIWGSIFLFFLFLNSGKLIFGYFKTQNPDVRLHLYILSATLLAAIFDEYLIGVNQMITVMFFISFSVLQRYDHLKKNESNQISTI